MLDKKCNSSGVVLIFSLRGVDHKVSIVC